MKLIVIQGLDIPETEITIRCNVMDQRLSNLLEHIREHSFTLEGRAGNAAYQIPLEQIVYLDSVDGRSFIYTDKQTYETRDSLAALEERLRNTAFIRISKNCILNLSFLKCVAPMWNHRMEATLKNGEKLVITRNYIDGLKEKLSKEGV